LGRLGIRKEAYRFKLSGLQTHAGFQNGRLKLPHSFLSQFPPFYFVVRFPLYLAVLLIWSAGRKRLIFLLFQEFLDDYELFKNTVRDLDLRLSSIVMQAFDDCTGLEGIFKASILLVHVRIKLLNRRNCNKIFYGVFIGNKLSQPDNFRNCNALLWIIFLSIYSICDA